MDTDFDSAPQLSLEERIDIALGRIRGINFFKYLEPIDQKWLDSQANTILNTLGLPNMPIKIFTNIDEGNKFAEQVDKNSEWLEGWEKIRTEALLISGGYNNTNMKEPWHYSRKKALKITEDLEDHGGRMERDAGKRCASWVQWVTIEEKIKKPNPLTPFILVNEKGADLIGPANGEFGIFVPKPTVL